jgi:adenosylcobinamide-phosphate synthase
LTQLQTTLAQSFLVTLLALAIEAAVGYPEALFRRIGHPATWIGALIDALDRRLNREDWPQSSRRAAGVIALAALILPCFTLGALIQNVALGLPFGVFWLAALASSLLAQRSLRQHVADVEQALHISLEQGRAAVAKIVGRDTAALDEAGVCRAAIESLAENFSDGVVAPTLWLALLGLPGALAYKAVNTADSMIGHRTPRFQAFGWASARFDDLLNWPAARLAAALLALAALGRSPACASEALKATRRDAMKHASPNAGWPESAMAGALGLQLGGPRSYDGFEFDCPRLGLGRSEATPEDIRRALSLYRSALGLLWLFVALATVASLF